MTLLNRVRNVLGLAVSHEKGRWWPAAVLALLAPPAVWLASTATITSAQEEKPADEGGVIVVSEQGDMAVGKPIARQPQYTANALLRVAIEQKSIIGGDVVVMDRYRFEIYKATQRQLLLSRFVLLAALRKPEAAKLPSVRREQARGDVTKWLAGQLQVTFPGDAEIMDVSLTSDNAKEAAVLVNAAVIAYLNEVVDAERNQKRQRLSQLDRAYVEKENVVRGKREDLKKLASTLGTSDTETLNVQQRLALELLSIYRQDSAKIQYEVRKLQGELVGQRAVLKSFDAADINDADIELMVLNDPIARQLITELGKRKMQQIDTKGAVTAEADSKSKYADRDQKELSIMQQQYDERRAELAEMVKQKKLSEIRTDIKRLEAYIANMREQEQSMRKLVEEKRREVEKFGISSVDIEMMRADIKNLGTVLTGIATERAKLKVEIRAVPRVTLLQRADVPEAPDR